MQTPFKKKKTSLCFLLYFIVAAFYISSFVPFSTSCILFRFTVNVWYLKVYGIKGSKEKKENMTSMKT